MDLFIHPGRAGVNHSKGNVLENNKDRIESVVFFKRHFELECFREEKSKSYVQSTAYSDSSPSALRKLTRRLKGKVFAILDISLI